jgi:hypothetical protein
MRESVGSVTEIQATDEVSEARNRAPDQRPRPVPIDRVQLSREAQAALREAVETPEQTAKEAASGDGQARRLLAKEEAAKEAAAKDEATSTTHVVA